MIKPICTETFTRADLNLIKSAPSHYRLILTINERIEKMLDSDELQITEEVATELHDIQNTIMETLNSDGNLNGTAIWV